MTDGVADEKRFRVVPEDVPRIDDDVERVHRQPTVRLRRASSILCAAGQKGQEIFHLPNGKDDCDGDEERVGLAQLLLAGRLASVGRLLLLLRFCLIAGRRAGLALLHGSHPES